MPNAKQNSLSPKEKPDKPAPTNATEKGSRRYASTHPDLYWRAWGVYRAEPTIAAVREALGCSLNQARGLVRSGVPRLGLPPLQDKLAKMLALANQLDEDEGARAVALGRGMLRTMQAKLAAGLAGRTFGPSEISTKDLAKLLLATQKRVEETAADPDREQQRLRGEESLGKALGGLLDAVVQRLMPNVGDALPTVEDLEALDLDFPLLTGATGADSEAG